MKKINFFICLIGLVLLTACTSGKMYYAEGMEKFEVKDYENAEECFKQAIDSGYKKDNVDVIYAIVSEYNNAKKAFDSEEFEKAQEYYDKIPNSYTNYIISHDIDTLRDRIEKTKKTFDEIKKAEALFEQGNYSDASAVILLMDTEYASEFQIAELENLKLNIKVKQKNTDTEYIRKINELVETYVYGLCRAINNNDFRSLKGCLYENSEIYDIQKSYVENYGNKNIYEYVDDFSVSNIDWITENECIVSTVETYEIYNDTDYRNQTFKYKYNVIETDDKQLFLTTIENCS